MIKPLAYINVEERKLEWAEPITWQTPTIAKMDRIPLYMRSSDEPAAWFYYRPGETGTFMCGDAEAMKSIEKNDWVTTPLYLHPAQKRTMVLDGNRVYPAVKELTNDEIMQVAMEASDSSKNWGYFQIDFARAILRKAQEK